MRKYFWSGLLILASTLCFAEQWQPANGPLKTRWAKDVSPDNALPEYPRPQMVRKEWQNLNGLWDYVITAKAAAQPTLFDGKILVPFPIESALSGVMKMVSETNRIWYRRTFTVPSDWKKKNILLHFGAVDWETEVFVNGQSVGSHRGGYDGFSFDITDALKKKGENEIVVSVWDPTDAGPQPRGKQVQKPRGIWYTPTSGIWQTVWLEPVTKTHISSLKITPSLDAGTVRVDIDSESLPKNAFLQVAIFDGKSQVNSLVLQTNSFVVSVPKGQKLWSPESPFLYDLKVSILKSARAGEAIDEVSSYFAMRKISMGKDEKGNQRMLLNDKPVFQFGPLDQGFWPDGLYTAPTDEALRYDIEMTKKLGFNMARKHVKVEPDRWYYWCDKLGLLVWQDMPSGDKSAEWRGPSGVDGKEIQRTPESAAIYEHELKAIIADRYNHPCIVVWVPFNEGWGQFDTVRILNLAKELDPTRLIDGASGGNNFPAGDIIDHHQYPGPGAPTLVKDRAMVLGEFGGLGLPLPGHTWQQEKNWGYRSFSDSAALTDAYVKLARELFPLAKEQSLSAAIYTQTTDVEVEVNGLMTYDREVVKVDLAKVLPANLNQLPPLPRKTVIAASAEDGINFWQYTFEKPEADWNKPEFDDTSWKKGRAGFGTRGTPGGIIKTDWNTPDIWLRREFTITGDVPKHPKLSIHHDEDAEVFVNGVLAAQSFDYTSDYVPTEMSEASRSALKPGKNVMAIHCHQTTGGQYIDAGIIDLAE
ncbi:MAG: beta-galactosidase/beta-glucuronidase [Verrucomicrobiales bacterium]|nr:beta-galactosidase/beta-glucuronidase [Verrucomicrobiales bacterium]